MNEAQITKLALVCLISPLILISTTTAQYRERTSENLSNDCRCNSKIVDLLTIYAYENGIDPLLLSFGRAHCGEAPQCGGRCDFSFAGKPIPLDIPCEPILDGEEPIDTYSAASTAKIL